MTRTRTLQKGKGGGGIGLHTRGYFTQFSIDIAGAGGGDEGCVCVGEV